MAKIKKIEPVNLFIGVIYSENTDEEICNNVEVELVSKFGKVELQKKDIKFDYTDYYNEELKSNRLFKNFYAFAKLVDPSELSAIKIFTNNLEAKYAKDQSRIFNLDPGYLTLAKVVLASCKDFSHRIYIGKGVFAETTLNYVNKKFSFLPWTYPDYQTKDYLDFFAKLRVIYKNKIDEAIYVN